MTTSNNSITTITLKALAREFDERHADRAKLAEEMQQSEDQGFAEQDAIARTWENAANVTWELCGGRPDGQFADRHHKVRIDARELGKLIELATGAKHVETDAEFAETNRALTNAMQRIRELTKERDNAIARIAELESAYANASTERDAVAARDDAKSQRITELEKRLAEQSEEPRKMLETVRGRAQ